LRSTRKGSARIIPTIKATAISRPMTIFINVP
jgi:hypothetical protein